MIIRGGLFFAEKDKLTCELIYSKLFLLLHKINSRVDLWNMI